MKTSNNHNEIPGDSLNRSEETGEDSFLERKSCFRGRIDTPNYFLYVDARYTNNTYPLFASVADALDFCYVNYNKFNKKIFVINCYLNTEGDSFDLSQYDLSFLQNHFGIIFNNVEPSLIRKLYA